MDQVTVLSRLAAHFYLTHISHLVSSFKGSRFACVIPLQTRKARGGAGSNRVFILSRVEGQRFEPGWVRMRPLATHP